mmetsp:Transcript_23821/g.55563  ORF Transcript_23821/g.55563 Transcript_23821/m.55563 type:complete len:268 (-) Transcript_23821:1505-2308(-)
MLLPLLLPKANLLRVSRPHKRRDPPWYKYLPLACNPLTAHPVESECCTELDVIMDPRRTPPWSTPPPAILLPRISICICRLPLGVDNKLLQGHRFPLRILQCKHHIGIQVNGNLAKQENLFAILRCCLIGSSGSKEHFMFLRKVFHHFSKGGHIAIATTHDMTSILHGIPRLRLFQLVGCTLFLFSGTSNQDSSERPMGWNLRKQRVLMVLCFFQCRPNQHQGTHKDAYYHWIFSKSPRGGSIAHQELFLPSRVEQGQFLRTHIGRR